jgi:uncharacterized membrane protein
MKGYFLLAVLLTTVPAGAQPLWRGNFLAGKSGLLMSPCRSGERLAVEDRTREHDLETVYRDLTQRPGRAIFAELQGRLEGKTLLAERLVRAQAEGAGCREELAKLRLRAQGSDPLWHLEARDDGVWLRTRGGQPPARFDLGSWTQKGGAWLLETTSEKSVLRITIREERCRDSMLGGLYTLRAIADLDGRKYSGCAYWGDLK